MAAAATLMEATRGIDWSVDELAAEADVARRTIFNHFDSLDDVVAAVGAEAFEKIFNVLLDLPEADSAGPESDLAVSIRTADLVGPLAALSRGFGLVRRTEDDTETVCIVGAVHPEIPARPAMLLLRSLAEISERLVTELCRRHSDLEPMDVELAVTRHVSELVVVHKYWLAETAAATDQASYDVWSTLLARLETPTRRPGDH